MAKKTRIVLDKAKSETQAKKACALISEKGLIQSISTGNTYRDCLKVFCDFIKENKYGDLRHATIRTAKLFLEHKAETVTQKKLEQYKQAIQALLHANGRLELKAKLESVQSKVETILGHRAYTAEQVQLVMNHQTPKMAFSTELAYRCGLRAHELLTIERTSDKRADKRFYADGRERNLSSKFDGMGDGVRYVVTGKGGLTREIFVPKDLAIQLEQRRLPEPIRVRDRGVFYVQKYDLAGGKKFTDSFAKASERALGWSTGAHGLRHSYAQERLKNLTKNYDYETAKETVSQEMGHFRPDITDAYLR